MFSWEKDVFRTLHGDPNFPDSKIRFFLLERLNGIIEEKRAFYKKATKLAMMPPLEIGEQVYMNWFINNFMLFQTGNISLQRMIFQYGATGELLWEMSAVSINL